MGEEGGGGGGGTVGIYSYSPGMRVAMVRRRTRNGQERQWRDIFRRNRELRRRILEDWQREDLG